MEKLSRYLIGVVALLAAYTVNMSWRMSRVAEYSELLGKTRGYAGLGGRVLDITGGGDPNNLRDEIDESTALLEELVASERRKAFFVVDWSN